MDSGLITILLPLALAIIMMGLGLELTPRDFSRVTRHPKAVFIALFCQLVVLVGIAFLLCKLFALTPLLSVGLMLLAASPGGATANLFSYLYKGDVALNITLTAINTIISIFTLPFIINLSLQYFMSHDSTVTFPVEKMIQVFLITLIPVIIGMLLRAKFPRLSITVSKSMRFVSISFLSILLIFAVFRDRFNLFEYFSSIGLATVILCFSSLFIGYCIPLLMGIPEKMARACTFEIGIHNTAIAITIAISVLGNVTMAIPAGIYTIVMYSFATIFGVMMSRQYIAYRHKNRLSDL